MPPFLGELDKAEKDYTESIELGPSQPRWYENRAQFWEQQGKPELAGVDRRRAQALRETSARARATVSQSPDAPREEY
jgi:Tfp pilus assembly protein PilF